MEKIILSYKDILKILNKEQDILKKYSVKKIGIFGSFVRNEQNKDSDIDFVVEFDNPSFDNYMDLSYYLEDLFGRNVDILTPEGVKSIRHKSVANEIKRSVIYA